MLRRFLQSLYPAIEHRDISSSERSLRRELERTKDQLADANRKLADVTEQLAERSVEVRIQQLEIEKLTAVCARDLSRVRAERDTLEVPDEVD